MRPYGHQQYEFVLSALRASASVRVSMNFSVPHLLGAASFARRVAGLERENEGLEFGPFYDEILSNATACVFLCVASLEAYANELFIDRAKYFSSVSPAAMEEIWGSAERRPVLEKFALFLRLRERPSMSIDSRPYGDIQSLVKLRNALTHFHSERDDNSSGHIKVSDALRNRFAPSPFVGDAEALFPKRWATVGCTRWAVTSCQQFASNFAGLASIEDRFVQFRERLSC